MTTHKGTLVGPNVASAPSSPVAGQRYFDTTTNKYFIYRNGAWDEVTDATRIFNIESAPYTATQDDYYTDGVSSASSTTFTSATANFTAGDVGKTIVILNDFWGGQDLHTTVAGFTNSTTITLTDSSQNGARTGLRFYISRAGDQRATIQQAIDDAAAAGGGIVFCPGRGYLISGGLVIKHRVWLEGQGRRNTIIHQAASSNVPVIRNDTTTNNTAEWGGIRHLWLDGNRYNQANTTTTLNGAYTAGNTTITLTSAANFFEAGMITIGSTRYYYSSKSGNTLNGVEGGHEGTTDTSQSNGATVTQIKACGVHLAKDPPWTAGTLEESYDTHWELEHVVIRNTKGDGFQAFGLSEQRLIDVHVSYSDEMGFRPTADSSLVNCTADTNGRAGFFLRAPEVKVTNCKSFYSGGITAADGYGFFLEGNANLEEGQKILSACSAQDNKADGYRLHNCQRANVQGTASSNGTGTIGTYSGVNLTGTSSMNIVDVICTERVASPNNAQQNALNIAASTVGQNQIRISHQAVTGSTVGNAIKTGSVLTGGNNISINGMGGFAAPTFAASTTLDPYVATTHKIGALTANITINAPTNAHTGCPLTVVLTQDGTGGRTVTWNAALKAITRINSAANAVSTWSFVYDGTNWIEVGADVPPAILNADIATTAAVEQRKLKNFTTPVTSLPASPVDGDMCVFDPSGWTVTGTAVSRADVTWMLRFATATGKWHFVGGDPLVVAVNTAETRTAAASYAAITTAGPGVTVAIAGDYLVQCGSNIGGSAACVGFASYDVGATGAVDADAAQVTQSTAAANNFSVVSSPRRKSGLAAATNILSTYKATTNTVTFQNRWISVTPIRLG